MPFVFLVAFVASAQSKLEEPPCTLTLQPCSRRDRSIRQPSQGCKESQHAESCSTHDAGNKNCRCTQSNTCRSQELADGVRHGEICESSLLAVHGRSHSNAL